MKKLQFKRKKWGGGDNWGEGLDYIIRDDWNKLDKLVQDNYLRKHNVQRINLLFPKMKIALATSIKKMKQFSRGDDKILLHDWLKKANYLIKYGETAKKLTKKFIFIDSVVQFLRQSSIDYIPHKTKSKIQHLPSFKSLLIQGLSVGDKTKDKVIKGRIKVILETKDFSKFKKGDILVAKETNANFLPIMEKAMAYVTERGSALCHAAIISRELKIPCIVAAKIATQVLKDGDLVEVDANKGIIKILKRNHSK